MSLWEKTNAQVGIPIPIGKKSHLSHADKIETVYGSRTQTKCNNEVSN